MPPVGVEKNQVGSEGRRVRRAAVEEGEGGHRKVLMKNEAADRDINTFLLIIFQPDIETLVSYMKLIHCSRS